jgi:mannose-6-phosphate isomerase-like protein (cupin superfamily)
VKVQVLRIEHGPALPLAEGGDARAVVWPGVGARHRSMHHLALRPGGATRPQAHAASEAVYYVVRGEGRVDDLDEGTSRPVQAGTFILITPGTRYRFVPSGAGLTVVGGPCPPDVTLYAGLPVPSPSPREDPR